MKALPERRFPFGRQVFRRSPAGGGPKQVFVLGAYPGAFHITWTPPLPYEDIQALAVDNEPEPFWDGEDEHVRFEDWKLAAGFEPGRHGSAAPASWFNGWSGRRLEDGVLRPLGIERAQACFSDCLDTYRSTIDGAARIADTYEPFAEFHGLPSSYLFSHPSDNAVVQETLAFHKERLAAELAQARPELLITLGNPALRVLASLVEAPRGVLLPSQLSAQSLAYGRRLGVRLESRWVEWLPLAHPGEPKMYRRAHEEWLAALTPQR